MKTIIVTILLAMILSGCVYSHTWHYQYMDADNRCYKLINDGGDWCFETELNLEYERHLFTDKAGFTYLRMNTMEALVQLPCVLLTELPFRWMWEKKYVYRVPVRYDKSLKVANNRAEGRWERLTWEDCHHSGITNVVVATVNVLDEYTGKSKISVVYYRGGAKVREVDLEPIVFASSHRLQTFDGRYVYIWDDFDRASYLYGYFRCGLAAKTSWCPILLELDLETGVVRRLVWTEYNTLYHSDDVVMERRR